MAQVARTISESDRPTFPQFCFFFIDDCERRNAWEFFGASASCVSRRDLHNAIGRLNSQSGAFAFLSLFVVE
jgi:hypothetical protein